MNSSKIVHLQISEKGDGDRLPLLLHCIKSTLKNSVSKFVEHCVGLPEGFLLFRDECFHFCKLFCGVCVSHTRLEGTLVHTVENLRPADTAGGDFAGAFHNDEVGVACEKFVNGADTHLGSEETVGESRRTV